MQWGKAAVLSTPRWTWALQPTAHLLLCPYCHWPSQAWQNGFPMEVLWSGSGQPGLLSTYPKFTSEQAELPQGFA